jgi:hypothetical protein
MLGITLGYTRKSGSTCLPATQLPWMLVIINRINNAIYLNQRWSSSGCTVTNRVNIAFALRKYQSLQFV